jgi:hypothetical protein
MAKPFVFVKGVPMSREYLPKEKRGNPRLFYTDKCRCPECKGLVPSGELMGHRYAVHGVNPPEKKAKAEPLRSVAELTRCPDCGLMIRSPDLAVHVSTHRGKKPVLTREDGPPTRLFGKALQGSRVYRKNYLPRSHDDE